MQSFKTIILCTSALALLGACGTTSSVNTSKSGSMNKVDAALERVAAQASQQDSLPFWETIYRRNSNDPEAAISYARALRLAGQLEKAGVILAPFARQENGPSNVKTEYAAIHLTAGKYIEAEEFGLKATKQNKKDYEAFHYLAIAQDALGLHKRAEGNFRKALKSWKGDPVPVLNNLALNLASQKRAAEAEKMIMQASALAPHRTDVERNKRIIQALPQGEPPKPDKKPA